MAECLHQLTRMTFRIASSGSRQYRRQCATCGAAVGQFVPHSEAERASDPPIAWDEELANRALSAKREAFRAKSVAWWESYNAYLDSPSWKLRRTKVLARSGGLCEGCRDAKATQVHHLTYDRVGAEMLFDLVAICDDCHEKIHADVLPFGSKPIEPGMGAS